MNTAKLRVRAFGRVALGMGITTALLAGGAVAAAADPPDPAPVANPALPQDCGLDIALVLDLSGSLSGGDVTASKNAATEFVSVLQGTPSSVGLYSFASHAPAYNNTNLDRTPVADAAGADTVLAAIDDLNRVGSGNATNWDRGFAQIPNGTYDMAVFVTDGVPTTHADPATAEGTSGFFNQVDLDRGVASANALKQSGTFVMGLGVGSLDETNLQYISGPTQGSDYYKIGNYDQLATTLRTIALENCAGTVTVVKEVEEADGTTHPGEGWEFTTNTGNVSPAAGVTGDDGAVNFTVDGYGGNTTSRDVTITENTQDGYELAQQNGQNAVCTNRATGDRIDVTNAGATGFTVPVSIDAAVSCVVRNVAQPTTVEPAVPDVAQAACTDDGEVTEPALTLPAATDAITYEVEDGPYTPGQTVRITATLASGFVWPGTLPDGWEADGDAAVHQVAFDDIDCDTEVPVVDPSDPPADDPTDGPESGNGNPKDDGDDGDAAGILPAAGSPIGIGLIGLALAGILSGIGLLVYRRRGATTV